ncbi:glycosyltransferase family 39 protein [Vibrio sp. CAU 1672]|uniref:ArnT family glycosyltransferase n=1 Tax=Vibrio sp. CAU 1672 TaxID=3032594 RepID=UPI0023D9AD8F|nr:glycosyltransferase family 39 protein [Vibrio sp. CAU 1672]MDF2152924.1 glycosyltransferase family 39 protein [Vibrio sp. CAU 1672]
MIKRLFAEFCSDHYYRVLLILLVFAVVIICAGMGLRSPWPADEPRFAEIAREMVLSGDWFLPMRAGELYPDKPPLFMWAIALCYKLSGNINLAFLLPNALMSLIMLICVYDLAAKLWNIKVARCAFLLLMLAPQFILQSKTGQTDALATGWVTLAMYGLIRHYYIKTSWSWYYLSWGFMGLGILTKGIGFLPIFFLIPVLVQQYWLGEKPDKTRLLKSAAGVLCLTAVIALWLLPMIVLTEINPHPDYAAYRDSILFKQTSERYTNAWTHIEPWYYYLIFVIPVLWFPLPLFFFHSTWWRTVFQHKLLFGLLLWVLLVVVFFSISPGKRGVYVLPALPMLALICAPWVASNALNLWVEKGIKLILFGLNTVFYVVVLLLLFKHPALVKHLGESPATLSFALFFFAVGVVWSGILFKARNQPALHVLGGVLTVSWLLYSTWGYLLLEPIRTPAKQIMRNVTAAVGNNGELGLVNFKEQFLLFSSLPVTHFSYLSPAQQQYRNAWLWIQEAPDRYVLMPHSSHIECFQPSNAHVMGFGHRRTWLLFDRSATTERCLAPEQNKRYHVPFRPFEQEEAKQ